MDKLITGLHGKADKPLGQYTIPDLKDLRDAKGNPCFPDQLFKYCERIDFGSEPIGRSNHSVVYLMRALDKDGKELWRRAAKESRHINPNSGFDYIAQRNPRETHATEAAGVSILKNDVIGSLVPSVDVPVGKLFLFSQWAKGKNSKQRHNENNNFYNDALQRRIEAEISPNESLPYFIDAEKSAKEALQKQRNSDLEIIARFNARCALHTHRFSRDYFSSPLRYSHEGRVRSRIDDFAKIIYFKLKSEHKIPDSDPFNVDQIKKYCKEIHRFDLDELVTTLVDAEIGVEKNERYLILNHGDFRPVHIVGSKGKEKIIDFELFGYHPRMHDVATYCLDEGGLAIPDLEEIIPTIALYQELYKVHNSHSKGRGRRIAQAEKILEDGLEKSYEKTPKRNLATKTAEFFTRSFIIDVHLDAGNKTKYGLGGEAYLQEFAKGQEGWTVEGALTQRLARVERNLKFAKDNPSLRRNLNGNRTQFYEHIEALGSLLGRAELIDY